MCIRDRLAPAAGARRVDGAQRGDGDAAAVDEDERAGRTTELSRDVQAAARRTSISNTPRAAREQRPGSTSATGSDGEPDDAHAQALLDRLASSASQRRDLAGGGAARRGRAARLPKLASTQ